MNLKNVVMNDTARIIARELCKKDRMRHFTNLTTYQLKLIRAGHKIVPNEFSGFFKDLETAGVGKLIHGRLGNPTYFNWFYFMANVGEHLVNPDTKTIMHKLDKPDEETLEKRRKIVIKRPTILDSEVIFNYKALDGSIIPINLIEADRLVEQVKIIKMKLSK